MKTAETATATPDVPGSDSSAPETVTPVENTGFDAIAADLAGSMPDVQQHAVDRATAQTAEIQRERDNAPTDAKGTKFDPALHAVDATGAPKKTATGEWAKKRGRKAGAQVSSTMPQKPGAATIAPAGVSPDQSALARAAGVQAAELVFMVGMVAGGQEWAPRVDEKTGLDERGMMQKAVGDYFVATGKTDIPPGVALTLALVAYAAPRFTMPQTQSRVSRARDWLASKWLGFRARRQIAAGAAESSKVG